MAIKPVKRVGSQTTPLTKKIEPAKVSNKANLASWLPTEKTGSNTDPKRLRWLGIAPAGWGKTELFMDNPRAVLLACEEGHKFVNGFKIIIDCFDYKTKVLDPWKDADGNVHMSFMQAVEALEEAPGQFDMAIVDTVDMLVKMVQDFFIEKKKVEHIEDIGAYGRGYDLGQNTPFRRAINRILKTGMGIAYLTHQRVTTAKFKKGEQSKKETTLPKGIWEQLVPQVDIVIHGELGGRRKPNNYADRIIVAEPSEDVLAKNRGGILPAKFILPFKNRWAFIEKFFSDPASKEVAQKEYDKHYD